MNSHSQTRPCPVLMSILQTTLFSFLILSFCSIPSSFGQGVPATNQQLGANTLEQIRLLQSEKLSRTPAQKKMSSQLLYYLRKKRQGIVGFGLNALRPSVPIEPDGRILVDLHAKVTPALVQLIRANGGLVVSSCLLYTSD